MNHLQLCFLKMIHDTSYKDCPRTKRGAGNTWRRFDPSQTNMEQVQEDLSAATISRNPLPFNSTLSLELKTWRKQGTVKEINLKSKLLL